MKIFMKILKPVLLAVVMIAALAFFGIRNINSMVAAETKKSSYTRTSFDYSISSPNAEQVASFRSNTAAVNRIFPFYVLSNAFEGADDLYLMFSDDTADSEISLFNKETLVAGELGGTGAVIDGEAARRLGAEVGDSISFVLLGESISVQVSAICLPANYSVFTDGLVQVSYSDVRAVYQPAAYSMAFIEANDEAALVASLADYVGEGNVVHTYESYVRDVCGQKPPYQSQEEYEASCHEKYDAYREEILEAAKRGGNQSTSKAAAYALIKDSVEKTERTVETERNYAAIASIALFFLISVLFIVVNRRDDKQSRDNGMTFGAMYGKNAALYFLTALVTAAAVFGILFFYGRNTYFPAQSLTAALWFSVPVVISGVLVLLFALIYFAIFYRNFVGGGKTPSAGGGGKSAATGGGVKGNVMGEAAPVVGAQNVQNVPQGTSSRVGAQNVQNVPQGTSSRIAQPSAAQPSQSNPWQAAPQPAKPVSPQQPAGESYSQRSSEPYSQRKVREPYPQEPARGEEPYLQDPFRYVPKDPYSLNSPQGDDGTRPNGGSRLDR